MGNIESDTLYTMNKGAFVGLGFCILKPEGGAGSFH